MDPIMSELGHIDQCLSRHVRDKVRVEYECICEAPEPVLGSDRNAAHETDHPRVVIAGIQVENPTLSAVVDIVHLAAMGSIPGVASVA